MVPWRQGVVEKVVDETYNTRRYFIRIDDSGPFVFKPGQFVTLDLPIGEKTVDRWRSYSIASAPSDDNLIELLIVLLEGGAGSTYIFNEVHEGTVLNLRGPQGVFTLPETIDCDLYLICTGTGIAPFRSMLHHMKANDILSKNIYLIFGCRTQRDLLYFPEMQSLQECIPNFSFMPTLSRENWRGTTGYVHGVYEELCGQKKSSDNRPQPAHFYLCGWKFMIEDARKKIAALGYDRKAIHFELYG